MQCTHEEAVTVTLLDARMALLRPVCGGCFSGSIRCWNEIGKVISDPSHRSDITRT